MIGRLIGFSRQLDILLRDDQVVPALVDAFLEGSSLNPFSIAAGVKEPAMAEPTKVMILDDEPIACERLKEFLERKGMSVEAFTDSAQAVARLSEARFQVLVTDLRMKGLTGVDVLLAVRRSNLPTQVIIMTGYRTSEATREAQYADAFGFVDKPLNMEALHTMVQKAAKKAAQQWRGQAG